MARSSLTRLAAHFSKEANSLRSPARCDALGRRAAEGVPDSRAEAEGRESAKRERAARARAASSGGQKPSDATELAEARERGEFLANGIPGCLSSSPARMRGKADFRLGSDRRRPEGP